MSSATIITSGFLLTKIHSKGYTARAVSDCLSPRAARKTSLRRRERRYYDLLRTPATTILTLNIDNEAAFKKDFCEHVRTRVFCKHVAKAGFWSCLFHCGIEPNAFRNSVIESYDCKHIDLPYFSFSVPTDGTVTYTYHVRFSPKEKGTTQKIRIVEVKTPNGHPDRTEMNTIRINLKAKDFATEPRAGSNADRVLCELFGRVRGHMKASRDAPRGYTPSQL